MDGTVTSIAALISGKDIVFMPERAAEWLAYDGLFCSTLCARGFAVAAYKAGYRVRPKVAA